MTNAEKILVDQVTTDFGSPGLEVAQFRLALAKAKATRLYEELAKAEDALVDAENALVAECRCVIEADSQVTAPAETECTWSPYFLSAAPGVKI